jgi:phage virion morphogenesis protein
LAVSTKKQRADAGRAGKILQVSGSLAASISPSYGDDFAVVGTNKVYAPIHQFGSHPYKIKPRNKLALAFGGRVVKSVNHPGVPARPFLGLSDTAKNGIIDAIESYISRDF